MSAVFPVVSLGSGLRGGQRKHLGSHQGSVWSLHVWTLPPPGWGRLSGVSLAGGLSCPPHVYLLEGCHHAQPTHQEWVSRSTSLRGGVHGNAKSCLFSPFPLCCTWVVVQCGFILVSPVVPVWAPGGFSGLLCPWHTPVAAAFQAPPSLLTRQGSSPDPALVSTSSPGSPGPSVRDGVGIQGLGSWEGTVFLKRRLTSSLSSPRHRAVFSVSCTHTRTLYAVAGRVQPSCLEPAGHLAPPGIEALLPRPP